MTVIFYIMDNLRELKIELHKKDIEIKKLKSLVTQDELTGLYNKRGFKDMLGRIFESASFAMKRPQERKYFQIEALSLLFLDIDNFKKINDAHGHKTGDHVLRYIAEIILQKVRSIDIAARWGGEEIVVALVGAGEGNAYHKAEEIRKAVRRRVRIPSQAVVPTTVSIGVAQLEENVTLDDLVKRADQAMYEAKNTGKDKTVKYSDCG